MGVDRKRVSPESLFMVRLLLFVFAGFCVGCVWSPRAAANGAEPASAVMSLLEAKCADCHSGTDPEGEFNLAALKAGSGDEGQRDKQHDKQDQEKQWARVFHVIVSQQMPPLDADQLTRVERSRATKQRKFATG
jgi:hypothetical protein